MDPAVEDLLPLVAPKKVCGIHRLQADAAESICDRPIRRPSQVLPHFHFTRTGTTTTEIAERGRESEADGARRAGIHHSCRLHVHAAQLGSNTTALNYLQARLQTPAMIYVLLYRDVQYLTDQVGATVAEQARAASVYIEKTKTNRQQWQQNQ